MATADYVLAGPWLGELGWELFCWQGRLRFIAARRKQVYVLTAKGHEFLYRDFAIVNELPRLTRRNNTQDNLQVIEPGCELVYYSPFAKDAERVIASKFHKQTFVCPKVRPLEDMQPYDLVLHCRARPHHEEHNWAPRQWQALVKTFKGKRIAAIGAGDDAFYPKGVDVFDAQPLEWVARLLKHHTRMLVGTSSGPMHLAALCKTPHVVITHPYNEPRYRKDWNPFQAKCAIVPSWQPNLGGVLDAIERMQEAIG